MDTLFSMYRLKEIEKKLKIPCENCIDKGIIVNECYKCGGKGWHYKTFPYWTILKYKEDVWKIDRDSNGELRYWTESDTFFEESKKLLHFTEKDAQDECDRRNKVVDVLLDNRKDTKKKNG